MKCRPKDDISGADALAAMLPQTCDMDGMDEKVSVNINTHKPTNISGTTFLSANCILKLLSLQVVCQEWMSGFQFLSRHCFQERVKVSFCCCYTHNRG